MKIRIKVDTNCTTDLLAIRDLIDYYLGKPDEEKEDVFAVDSYGGIVRSTNDMWLNHANKLPEVTHGADITRDVMEMINKTQVDVAAGLVELAAIERGYGYAPISEMRKVHEEHELDDPQVVGKGSPEKKPPKDTELIDNAIKKRSLTDDWDRYR